MRRRWQTTVPGLLLVLIGAGASNATENADGRALLERTAAGVMR